MQKGRIHNLRVTVAEMPSGRVKRVAAGSVGVALVCALAALGCAGEHDADPARVGPGRLASCVAAWNRPANFTPGSPGRAVQRLGPKPSVPLFAHLSLDKRRRCVVFLDTPSTADDRRFVRSHGRFGLDCAGDCGQDVPRGAKTFQFLRDGSLP
jgi:hypothetical protein